MGMVALSQRIANAFVVVCGAWGAVSRRARECQISRQRIYREADEVERQLEGKAWQHERQTLRDELQRLRYQHELLEQRLAQAVVLDADKQAEFATVGQAVGVSLSALRTLLEVLQPGQAPSVAQLGRWTQAAGHQAGQLLQVLDEAVRGQVRQVLADEIFVRDPVLMMVEPESLCWLSGRKVTRQELTGQTWAREFAALPALEQATCDAGPSLHRGLAEVNAQRRAAGKPEVAEQLDHFHSLWGGGVALAGMEKRLRGAIHQAERLQSQLDKRRRNGQALQPWSNRARAAWAKAERLMDQWTECSRVWQQIKAALPLVTPEAELNTRARAEAILKTLLPQLPEAFVKSVNLLERKQVLTYLDRVHQRLETVAAPPEIRDAAVRQEILRSRPELWRDDSPKAAVLRGVLLACAAVLHHTGVVGQRAVEQVRSIFRESWRASSLVECINSVVRMQQARHRKMTQGLLDLKRLYWNSHVFRTGRRRGTSPYQRVGLPWPNRNWWELLKTPPERLRQELSTQTLTA